MHPLRRASLLALIVFVSTPLARAQSDLTFDPYTVYVAEQEGHARCGPSDDYYRTDPLRQGQALDVYAETDDGWLGIRPPQDSFCWIPADTAEMDASGDTGTIIEDRTVAWIGTHLGRARTYRWQVQLTEGEAVTVIGKSERDGPDGPQLWYRIVPPSGEYRWVHRDQVVESSEELVASLSRRSARDDRPGGQPTRTQSASNQPTEQIDVQAPRAAQPTSSSSRPQQQRDTIAASGPSVVAPEQSGENQGGETWQSNDVRQSGADVSAAGTPSAAGKSGETMVDAMKQGGLLASVEFIGRPRLIDIGGAPSAPNAGAQAGDANWVAGVARPASTTRPGVPNTSAATSTPMASGIQTAALNNPVTPANPIMQASGQQALLPSSRVVPRLPAATAASTLKSAPVVPAERIAQIEAETVGADVDRLGLIFSRLMAAQATEVETEPVARSARRLASTSLDTVVAGRARLLAERAEQYQRLATRRDGNAIISGSDGLGTPTSLAVPTDAVATVIGVADAAPSELGVSGSSLTGYLVQVYSARTDSPPFALTDNAGRTLAYVSPTPGVNLRTHLNSKVTVLGTQGYLTGLNTPHIQATGVARTPE